MISTKFVLLLSAFLYFLCLSNSALADNRVKGNGSPFLLTPISSQIAFEEYSPSDLKNISLSFGFYKENLRSRVNKYYHSRNLGVRFAFIQHIRNFWYGSVEVAWSDWELTNTAVEHNYAVDKEELKYYRLFPLKVSSRIELYPHDFYRSQGYLLKYLQPSLVFGLGYVRFFASRTLAGITTNFERGQPTASWGASLRLIVPDFIITPKFTYELWRGLSTRDYISHVMRVDFIFGQNAE